MHDVAVLRGFNVQQAVSAEPGLDLIAFETVPCAKELRAISRLLRTESLGLPAWVSCSCSSASANSHGESLVGEHLFVCNAAPGAVARGCQVAPCCCRGVPTGDV